MANSSISGLISGLDTSAIIKQLMQLEAQPQTRLKTRLTGEQSTLTALQSLNSKLASVTTKAAELGKSSSWALSTAITSSPEVTARAGSDALPAVLTFSVGRLATRSQSLYGTSAGAADPMAPPATQFQINYPDTTGVQETFSTGDGSLAGIAAAINATSTRVTAALVRSGGDATNPTYRLSITSRDTGFASRFSMADPTFLGGVPVGSQVDGADASITVQGQTLTSSSNTFEGLMPGVDVTLGAEATGSVTVTVAPDSKALNDRAKALVDAVNAALSDIDALTSYDPVTKKAGALVGDATLRTMRDQLLRTASDGLGVTSLAVVGIETDRSGRLTFDQEVFAAAYANDPVGTQDAFVSSGVGDEGFAASLEVLGKNLSNSSNGTLTLSIKTRTTEIGRLGDDIERWDARLEVRRQTLERTYGALEVALGKLQSQSSWLAGQISSLPKMGS